MADYKQKDSGVKKYEKPAVRIIELAADEVLGGNCKTVAQGSSIMNGACKINRCTVPGS